MDTSNPSRPGRKPASAKADAGGPAMAYWVSFTLDGKAPPFSRKRGGADALTEGGRKVAECWRSLGEGRPYLEADSVSIGPRTVQGILRLRPGHPQAITLSAAARLFKLISARALAGAEPAKAAAGAPWKKGYVEKPLETLKQVVEARAALKAPAAGAKPRKSNPKSNPKVKPKR